MSGVEDGTLFKYDTARGDGTVLDNRWTITIGRLEHCDVRLVNDNYISREHAKLYCIEGHWWLEDCKSRNGTFITHSDDFFKDNRVRNTMPLEISQLFRVGRTWLRLQPID
jgi:predicted component of type VI protein secretion system